MVICSPIALSPVCGKSLNHHGPSCNLFDGDVFAAASTTSKYGILVSFMGIVINPIIGFMSDKYGRKPILIMLSFCSIGGFVALSFMSSRIALFLYMMSAMLESAFTSVQNAAVVDISRK